MNRGQRDQDLRDIYQLVLQRTDLDGPGKAALLEAWNAREQREHERAQRADERKQQRFETLMGFFALIALLLATLWLAQGGHTWVAVALIPPMVVVVGKFLGRPVTTAEASMIGSGISGAFRGLRQALNGAPPQPAPPPGSVATNGPAGSPVP
ncbi:hypothetical protein GCM10010371_57310 [Streptomyces subrutilus]|uniref:Uncharacterized protein n=1 Tax=Streptomyces subrutilus TaxID=36818 RepID=A0A918RC52_9ACTN|nr:hypothetical protein [Streptomyces subrutilus]GGZ89949.1 hypothetical protein GCM10010371_57310 [Streptomyces subrutilus]